MIVSLKIIIEEDKRVSLVINKTPELAELLENVVNVVENSFPNVRITSRDDYYHFTGMSGTGSFATLKSFIEEVYIRFIDKESIDDGADEFFMI